MIGRLIFCWLMAGALVMPGCASRDCKPNPPGVTGCIPASCESCGPVGSEHYKR